MRKSVHKGNGTRVVAALGWHQEFGTIQALSPAKCPEAVGAVVTQTSKGVSLEAHSGLRSLPIAIFADDEKSRRQPINQP